VEKLYPRLPYYKHKDRLDDPKLTWVFENLQGVVPYGGIAKLAAKVNIPASTVQTWKMNVDIDPTWRPSHEAYSDTQRTFTDEEEQRLLTQVMTSFLEKGLYYSDADFKVDALQFHQHLVAEAEAEALSTGRTDPIVVRAFKYSPPFIIDFRKRHMMSLRRPSIKRRPTTTDAQVRAFVENVKELMRIVPAERIMNIDETNWRPVAAGFKTWAPTGAESVHCIVDNDDKQGVTVIAAISAAEEKLPLTVIGKGKTQRCLAGYDLPSEVWGEHSESGWTTSDIMCCYFWHLRHVIFPEGPLSVILDTYSAHRSAEVPAIARLWGINLVFIPPGCTDRLQPLDRRVFGVLNAYAHQIWRKRYHATGGEKVTKAMVSEPLVEV
jgi:hypothetical protein